MFSTEKPQIWAQQKIRTSKTLSLDFTSLFFFFFFVNLNNAQSLNLEKCNFVFFLSLTNSIINFKKL
jgi:hypothetical protein